MDQHYTVAKKFITQSSFFQVVAQDSSSLAASSQAHLVTNDGSVEAIESIPVASPKMGGNVARTSTPNDSVLAINYVQGLPCLQGGLMILLQRWGLLSPLSTGNVESGHGTKRCFI